VRVTRDIDLAEECVQDAYAKALTSWRRAGVPARPAAWLTTVARRNAGDAVRRRATLANKLPLLVENDVVVDVGERSQEGEAGDDRLRLVFTCCHPALALEARVALTLRLLCGLTTGEVAKAFLVSETTMAARITRAKKKIAAIRIPYRVPAAAELPSRIDGVLNVIHLLFTTGHTAPAGPGLVRNDLVERSLDLARMLRQLLPDDADVAGLLALILLTDSRRDTRLSPDGRMLLIHEQDRRRWDQPAIEEGLALVTEALRRRPPGRYALQAAICAVHAQAPDADATDWRKIVELYDQLRAAWPSPVVTLNRAVAVGLAEGPEAGLSELETLRDEPQLRGYPYLPSARAHFLRRVGRLTEARTAYEDALALTDNDVERRWLGDRLEEIGR
jgi:RNA polymerase sigma factor (sigma-70 family)